MRAARGFTLVEMIVVIAIIAILSSIATLSWNRMVMKNTIEGQIKTVHADMMGIRLDSLYSKRARSVTLTGNLFRIYSSTATGASVTPVSSRTFKYNFISTSANTPASDTVTFDTSGMANGTQISFCVDPFGTTVEPVDAVVDSIVVSQARINLGKRKEGGSCVTGDIIQK